MTEKELSITNDAGDTLCLCCRRFIPVAYDADYCVFGRHMRKKSDDAIPTSKADSGPGDV